MKYHKIYSPHRRNPDTNRLDLNEWTTEEFYILRNLEWIWTEKVDGTNIRVIWDGYSASFQGRTDRAIIPDHLLSSLENTFGSHEGETLLEQTFGDKPAVLYGEGYGPKINDGSKYRPDHGFILFDVVIDGGPFLARPSVASVAESLGIKHVPVLYVSSLNEMVTVARGAEIISAVGQCKAEGVVGYPAGGFLDRQGNRIITKIKNRDYYGLEDGTWLV